MMHGLALVRSLLGGGSLLPLMLVGAPALAVPPSLPPEAEVALSDRPTAVPALDWADAFGAALGTDPDLAASVNLQEVTFGTPLALELDAPEAVADKLAPEPATPSSSATELMPLAAAIAPPPLPAAPGPLAQVRPAPQDDGWEYVLQPYLFIPVSIQSTVNVAGVEQSVSVGLGDLFNFDRVLAGALRFEARNPQYGFFGDLSYVYARDSRSLTNFPLPQVITDPLSLVSPVPVPPGTPASVTTTASTSTTTLDLGGFYRVVDQPLGDGGSYPRLLVDPLAGLRLIFLSGSVDFSNIAVGPVPLGGRSLSRSATLVQPLIGVQASLELSERWAVGLRGDLAGFGLGADENLSWNILLGTRYSFSDTLALQLAYRFTELRYRQGQGADGFGLAQSQNGLWVGLDIGL